MEHYLAKIRLILFAFITLNLIFITPILSNNSVAASFTAKARATILERLIIVTKTELFFGTIEKILSEGSIIISPDGNREVQNVNMQENDYFAPAAILVAGEKNKNYNIIIPEIIYINDAVKDDLKLSVTEFKIINAKGDNVTSSSKLSAEGDDNLFIGAKLNIPANASPGTYSVDIPIKLSY